MSKAPTLQGWDCEDGLVPPGIFNLNIPGRRAIGDKLKYVLICLINGVKLITKIVIFV
jgi:hypothetical protein